MCIRDRKNAINKQFEMIPGSKEVDTIGTFKNDAAVLNMGHPTNYGMADPSPLPDAGHGTKPSKKDGHTHSGEEVYKMAMDKVQKQLKNNRDKPNPKIKMGIGTGFTSL